MIGIIRSYYYDYYCYQSQCQATAKKKDNSQGAQQDKIKKPRTLWGGWKWNGKYEGERARHKEPPYNSCWSQKFMYCLFICLCSAFLLLKDLTHTSHTVLLSSRQFLMQIYTPLPAAIINIAEKYISFQRLLSTLRSVCSFRSFSSSLLSPCHVSASLPHVPELFI